MSKHLAISKEELLWVILTENYSNIAYKMLNDIGQTKRISYKKVSYYLNHMMHNWPDEAVLRTVKTWMIKLDGKFDSKKIPDNLYKEFHNRYSEKIMNGDWSNKIYPEPENT